MTFVNRSNGSRRLSAAAFFDSLPSLSSADAAFADAHSPGDVPLGNNPDRQLNRLLHPLSNPLPRIDTAALDDLLDRRRQRGHRVCVLLRVSCRRRIHPVCPLLGKALRECGKRDAVDGIVEIDSKSDQVVSLVRLLNAARLGLLLIRRTSKQVRLSAVTDRLDGEEDVGAAHGVGFGEDLAGRLRGFLNAALAGEEVGGVALGTDAHQLGSLDEALDGAEVALDAYVTPPGAVGPAGGAASCESSIRALARFGSSLDDHEIAALHLGHDARECGIDDGIKRGIVVQIMGDVDLEALVLGNGWS